MTKAKAKKARKAPGPSSRVQSMDIAERIRMAVGLLHVYQDYCDEGWVKKQVALREAEVAKHRAAIEQHWKMHADAPARVAQIREDIKALYQERKRVSVDPKVRLLKKMRDRIAKLEAEIAGL